MAQDTFINFRATKELSRGLNRVKRQTGMSIGHQIRAAVARWLESQTPAVPSSTPSQDSNEGTAA